MFAGRSLQEALTGERTRSGEDDGAVPAPTESVRPASERWHLKKATYDSTRDLLSALKTNPELAEGPVSHYHRVTAAQAPTRSERLRVGLIAAVAIGAVGAFVGAIAGGALLLIALIGGLMTLVSYGHPADPSVWLFLGPVALGYAIAAAIGFKQNWRESKLSQGFNGLVGGELRRGKSGAWEFVPEGASAGVNLAEYAAAPKYQPPANAARRYDPFLGLAALGLLGGRLLMPLWRRDALIDADLENMAPWWRGTSPLNKLS